MKELINDKEFVFRSLIVTSLIMFTSVLLTVLVDNAKIMAIGMTLWLLNLGWIMYLLIRGNVTEMIEYNNKNADEAKENKQYFKFIITSAAFPLVLVGLLFIVLNLILLFII